jgi:hypothetical protein
MSRKVRSTEDRFFEKVNKTKDCWLWLASTCGPGYGQFWTGERLQMSHRWAYSYFIGSLPEGKVVMHTCDQMLCVKPEHLKLGTQAQNLADMHAKGRNRKPETYIKQAGEKCWNAKLTNEQAAEIRKQHDLGVSSRTLADKYTVNYTTINNIVKGRRYVVQA